MKLIRLKAIIRKEFIQIVRDPFSLVLSFILPVLLLFIFGYAITVDVDKIRTVICDRDKSLLSREFVASLTASGYFSVVDYIDSYDAIDGVIDGGKARMAVAFPEDFSKNVSRGRPAQVLVVVDGSDSNTATISIGYLAAVSDLFARRMAGARPAPQLIEPRIRVWYNPELKSRYFIVPGLVAIIMAIIAALLTSLTIARERERGTMEQLIATPVKVPELITGKLAAYFVIGIVDVVITVLTGVYLFGVPFRGSFVLLMLLSSIFLFGGLGLGILVSTVAGSQLLASQISLITSYLPALLLSGFMFSLSNMPMALQVISHIIPARYFVAILKGIFLKGNGLAVMALEAGLLTAYAGIVFVIVNLIFKKRID